MPSKPAQVVLVLAVFAAVGVIMIGPVAETVGSTTGSQTVTNESIVANYDTAVDLEGYDVDSGSETVYGFNDTSGSYEVVTSPGNYSFNYAAGEITVNSSSTVIQDGETVLVSYTYQAAGTLATLVIGFIPLALGLLVFIGVANGVEGYL